MMIEEFDKLIDKAAKTLRRSGVEPTHILIATSVYKDLVANGLVTKHGKYRGLYVEPMPDIDQKTIMYVR